jgi:uncharacterized protein YjbJ (UPF0337 family)
MGAHEKVSNKIDDFAGKAKEVVGKATGDDGTRVEGKESSTRRNPARRTRARR